jgi:hypothetical protein
MSDVRTQDGKVILKDNKVSCECCLNTCGTTCAQLATGGLLTTLNNATTGTLNGGSPIFADKDDTELVLIWVLGIYAAIFTFKFETDCFFWVYGDNFNVDRLNFLENNSCVQCSTNETCVGITYTINGASFTGHSVNVTGDPSLGPISFNF